VTSPHPPWLPGLLLLEDFDGDAKRYLAEAHAIFERDFGQRQRTFLGKRVGLKRHPLINGWSATFWHFISEGKVEDDRDVNPRRCERIAWPSALMAAADRSSPDVHCWNDSNPRGQTTISVALTDFSYLLVVADRGDYVLPWTAYPVDRGHQRKKLRNRLEEALSRKG